MTENIKVTTGSSQHVESEIAKYMAEFPDGQILSTAAAISADKKTTKVVVVLGRKL